MATTGVRITKPTKSACIITRVYMNDVCEHVTERKKLKSGNASTIALAVCSLTTAATKQMSATITNGDKDNSPIFNVNLFKHKLVGERLTSKKKRAMMC